MLAHHWHSYDAYYLIVLLQRARDLSSACPWPCFAAELGYIQYSDVVPLSTLRPPLSSIVCSLASPGNLLLRKFLCKTFMGDVLGIYSCGREVKSELVSDSSEMSCVPLGGESI